MNEHFGFNHHKYNLWPIYECISTFYPIGIDIEENGIYFDFPGIKNAEKLIVEHIHDETQYKNNWVDFTNWLEKVKDLKAIGTTYGQSPSYSGYLEIEKSKFENVAYAKQLHFSVSLLGNFFQVYGMDITEIIDGEYTFKAVHSVTTSPTTPFKDIFEFVEREIRTKFQDYLFIPFAFGQQSIKGLHIRYIDDPDCTINQALFNDFLGDRIVNSGILGDQYYGINDWKR